LDQDNCLPCVMRVSRPTVGIPGHATRREVSNINVVVQGNVAGGAASDGVLRDKASCGLRHHGVAQGASSCGLSDQSNLVPSQARSVWLQAGVQCEAIYGSMEQTTRTGNLNRFRNRKCRVLVVTDVAARGIDVPLLDNVVNFDFPDKPKLFVHRYQE
jgi:ERCC4-related helicase